MAEQTLEPPKEVTRVDGEWFYSERAPGDYVMRLGFDEMPKFPADPSDAATYPALSTEHPSLPASSVEIIR